MTQKSVSLNERRGVDGDTQREPRNSGAGKPSLGVASPAIVGSTPAGAHPLAAWLAKKNRKRSVGSCGKAPIPVLADGLGGTKSGRKRGPLTHDERWQYYIAQSDGLERFTPGDDDGAQVPSAHPASADSSVRCAATLWETCAK